VAPLYRFKTDDEAIKMANDTPHPNPPPRAGEGKGLPPIFYSRDIGRIWRVAEALEMRFLGINAGIISPEIAPFAGMRESGIDRQCAWSVDLAGRSSVLLVQPLL
jgi:succinate-semialdehyde dehydrogenase/glutarate-semialdehyde dehydrogenase